jgi:hypothetical protein
MEQLRKGVWFFFVMVALLVFCEHLTAGTYSGGAGTAQDPYLIADANDLLELADCNEDYDKHFLLINDINLAGYEFTTAVIAADTNNASSYFQGVPFSGFFDGNRHVISNLTIDTAGAGNDYLGLFGRIDRIVWIEGYAAKVENLGLENVNIAGGDGSEYLGGICGYNEFGMVINCYSTGSVNAGSGSHYLGGLCGQNRFATVLNCYSTCDVNSGDNSRYIGGLSGMNAFGWLYCCYSTGSVIGGTGTIDIGGLCGGHRGYDPTCFWDVETSGIGEAGDNDGGATGKTTAQMQDIKTFLDAGWVFADYQTGIRGWYMPANDYPKVYWQNLENKVAVPEITGLTLPEAQAALIGAGLTLGDVYHVASWQMLAGRVAGIDKFIAGFVEISIPVDIYVSVGSTADGSEGWPYEIACQGDLDAITDPCACYVMTADIYMSYYRNYTDAVVESFWGTFDGDGYVINNLIINRGADFQENIGLFGNIELGAEVKNLGLKNVNIFSFDKCAYVGGLCGVNKGSIGNCYATGSIIESYKAGGLCGINSGGTISDSHAESFISGGGYLGGFLGSNSNGSIINCYSTGSVRGTSDIGGLCGRIESASTVNNCYATGSVVGSTHVGGLCGYSCGIGNFISNCYATGSVVGGDYVGGLCGRGQTMGIFISNSYATGSVVGRSYVGGLCGHGGKECGILRNCYATGAVVGEDHIGGLCAYGASENSFWDIETSGVTTSASGTGKSTAEMKNRNTFLNAGWEFADYQAGTRGWYMPANSYPLMDWQNSDASIVPEVTGMTLGQAQDALTGLGLTVGDVFHVASWQIPAERVTGLDKFMGGYVDRSAPIDIYISAGSTADGSETWPYEIACQTDMNVIDDPCACYIMTADIYMGYYTSYNNAVIESLWGTFDGDGHVINNLTIKPSGNHIGLFGNIESGAELRNLCLKNINIIITGFFYDYIGSLCGVNRGGITNCYVSGKITSEYGSNYLGGLCGGSYGSIGNCYFTGTVAGETYCNYLGGLCGIAFGNISNCYSNGAVTGGVNTRHIGGLCGHNEAIVTNCYARGSVSGGVNSERIGGLCGDNGGMCGYDEAALINCYSTGKVVYVEGSDYIGGVCGRNVGDIDNCFWDVETSAFGLAGDDNFGAIGKTTAQMQTMETFTDAGWDFGWYDGDGADWFIQVGEYPILTWQISPADIYTDGLNNWKDFAVFAEFWQRDDCSVYNNYCDWADLDFSGDVGIDDLVELADYWLATGVWD